MTDSSVPPLAIGIASSPADRRRLALLLGGTEAFLIVSHPDQARQFLEVVSSAPIEAVPDGRSGLRVDSDRRVLRWMDREIALTPLEHDFLNCLIEAPGRVWTYEKLHVAVWGTAHVGKGSDIHSTVRRVRAKLVRLGAAVTIDAIRGVGIRLVPA